MKRQELAHILRAACQIAGEPEVLVLGSQAILGSYDEDELPAAATSSIEADIAFLDDPQRHLADAVDGAIGELSSFHQTNGYYAEGIHIDTALLPHGWRSRLISWNLQSSRPATPLFLEPHDLAAAKLMAGRPKDLAFVSALLSAGLIEPRILSSRIEQVSASELAKQRAMSLVSHWL